MSDIREAFELWWRDALLHGKREIDADGQHLLWLGWKAALQSQTAPAVPEKREWNQCCGRDDFKFTEGWNACRKAMLTAAPAPDHSPDAGKVVWAVIDRDGQIAYSVTPNDEYLEEWAISSCHEHINEAVTEGIEGASQWVVRPLSVGKTAPQPVQSENEVKAQIHALELWSAHFEELADNATENGYPDHGDGIRDAASEMKAEAARLRASQQEGGER